MKKQPLVSVIVPTYNSEAYLEGCLKSISSQTYPSIELIVVDNNSSDYTKKIAKRYTDKVFNKGPERSAQRNYGVKKSKGKYVLIIDSDMELTKNVVDACVEKIHQSDSIKGIVIPEKSFGEGFWAQCKELERSYYVGVIWMEAARFFEKQTYEAAGGYDEDMVSGEDWDLSQRVAQNSKLARVDHYIMHNEQRLSLTKTCKKKFYYGKSMHKYMRVETNKTYYARQSSLWKRCAIFLSKPSKLFKNPVVGAGMLFLKACEFGSGGLGYLIARFKT